MIHHRVTETEHYCTAKGQETKFGEGQKYFKY